ncbi:hypothetical protein BT93_B1083 [Corymbia citriodora subsp. variegata]|nr:hypothetical protein BT93_B1083 [Corymbia citriodora subsp. variegata]KAF8038431.1 hypothetical protein BT93_B1083 [Corymbia citriodora subsp. variegata]
MCSGLDSKLPLKKFIFPRLNFLGLFSSLGRRRSQTDLFLSPRILLPPPLRASASASPKASSVICLWHVASSKSPAGHSWVTSPLRLRLRLSPLRRSSTRFVLGSGFSSQTKEREVRACCCCSDVRQATVPRRRPMLAPCCPIPLRSSLSPFFCLPFHPATKAVNRIFEFSFFGIHSVPEPTRVDCEQRCQFARPMSLSSRNALRASATSPAGSIEGQVVEIGLMTASLLNDEKFPIIIPNSLFSSQGRDELYTRQQDILLQSVQIIK